MAVMMKMHCDLVTEHGGGLWVPLCKALNLDMTEAWPPHGHDLGLTAIWGHSEGECVQCDDLSDELVRAGMSEEPPRTIHIPGKSREEVTLSAVIGDSEDNKDWALATPAGTMNATIDNPAAWGVFKPGQEYMLKVTRHHPTKGRDQKN